jgi:hypothetical protein
LEAVSWELLGEMDAPFIVQLPIEEFEHPPIEDAHPEASAGGDAPRSFHRLDKEPLPLPNESGRPFSISIARMTLDDVRRHASILHAGRRGHETRHGRRPSSFPIQTNPTSDESPTFNER